MLEGNQPVGTSIPRKDSHLEVLYIALINREQSLI